MPQKVKAFYKIFHSKNNQNIFFKVSRILRIFGIQHIKSYNIQFKKIKPLNYLKNIKKIGGLSFMATSWRTRLKKIKP